MPDLVEYRLAPLTRLRRREFINRWLRRKGGRGPRLLEAVHSDQRLGEVTRNGLLLTLACAAAGQRILRQDTRRVDLYRLIVRDMVRGEWRDGSKGKDSRDVSVIMDMLRRCAWTLFQEDPARTQFADGKVREALRSAGCHSPHPKWTPDRVLDEMCKVGLFSCPSDAHLMFLHRSFLEFLAAEHVAMQPEPLALVERFLWQRCEDGVVRWQPGATGMLSFVAGCVQSAGPFLERVLQLDDEMRDEFRTMLLVAVLVSGRDHSSRKSSVPCPCL